MNIMCIARNPMVWQAGYRSLTLAQYSVNRKKILDVGYGRVYLGIIS